MCQARKGEGPTLVRMNHSVGFATKTFVSRRSKSLKLPAIVWATIRRTGYGTSPPRSRPSSKALAGVLGGNDRSSLRRSARFSCDPGTRPCCNDETPQRRVPRRPRLAPPRPVLMRSPLRRSRRLLRPTQGAAISPTTLIFPSRSAHCHVAGEPIRRAPNSTRRHRSSSMVGPRGRRAGLKSAGRRCTGGASKLPAPTCLLPEKGRALLARPPRGFLP